VTDPERLANQLAYEAREAYQAWLDAALTPASDAAALQTRANWQPIEDFIEEGPDVGYREEPESEEVQRIN
jgi:hypothetical protein